MASGQNHGRGWFEGTMEVISGMAPRPSTPQPFHARPASAPNSPARNAFANFPGINRLPSQDSLDRSIHNESGHGKSTAQIIRDLKTSNAQLSAKQAAMEAKFMNQLSEVTNDMKAKHEEQTSALKQRNAQLEAYKMAAETKLKELDTSLTKTKEESNFQRHTVSDLKNQLYQLQQELEEQDMEKRDDFERLLADNQDMARELQTLQNVVKEEQKQKRELELQLEEWRKGETSSEDYYRQLQETQGELESQRERLSMAETKMEDMHTTLKKEHSKQVEELQDELQTQSEHFKNRERDLQSQIENLEFTDSQVTVDLRQQMEERENTILELQNQLDEYAESNAALSHTLEQLHKDAASQEQYRRDEAEDLRVLNDALEEEVAKMGKQLDEARTELELRDQELEEKDSSTKEEVEELKKELEASQKKVSDSQKELAVTLEMADSASRGISQESNVDPDLLKELEDKLFQSNEKTAQLSDQIEDIQHEHKLVLDSMQMTIDSLKEEKQDLSKELEKSKKEKDDALNSYAEKDSEFSKLKSHWEEKSGAENEVMKLRQEIDVLKQRNQESADAEKVAHGKAHEYESQLKELGQIREEREAAKEEIDQLKRRLESEVQVASRASSDEVMHLRDQLNASEEAKLAETDALRRSTEELEAAKKEIGNLEERLEKAGNGGGDTARVKKQLREAQIALVALDDEKKEMTRKHRELLSAVEKKKEEIQRDSAEQLQVRDAELKKLESKLVQVEAIASENEGLRRQVEAFESTLKEKEGAHALRIQTLEKEISQLRRELAAAPSNNSSSSVAKELEDTIKAVTKEKDTLRVKLKDRDTTIAALVRSSVSLEAKLSSMEQEVKSLRSTSAEEVSVAESELNELRQAVTVSKVNEPKLQEEILGLRKDLKMAKSDAKRWKRALKEDGGTGSEYRYQISILQKEVEKQSSVIDERDRAIENLVNQSMSQDSHLRDLKKKVALLTKEVDSARFQKIKAEDGPLKAEVRRLQQESEIFAGQIIEQDEELQNLKHELRARDEEIAVLQKDVSMRSSRSDRGLENNDEATTLKAEVSRLQTDLKARDTQMVLLRKEIGELKHKSNPNDGAGKITSLQAELDELRDAGESDRIEIRDLRKQLWKAKEAAGEATDLRNELAQAKYALDEYKRKDGSNDSGPGLDEMKAELEQTKKAFDEYKLKSEATSDRDDPSPALVSDLQMRLNEALSLNQSLEEKLASQESNSVDELKTRLKEKEDLVNVLQNTSTEINESQVAMFQRELEVLRNDIAAKSGELEQARRDLDEREAALEKSEMLKLKLLTELSSTKSAYSKLEQSSNSEQSIDKSQEMEQIKSLTDANAEMANELTQLKSEIESTKRDLETLDDLKVELEKAKMAREAAEQNIVQSYEHQLSALSQDRDATIDSLRRDLAEARGRGADDVSEMSKRLNSLQNENSGLRDQFEVELQAKNQQIYALEHTLHAQEQIVENMRAEMDQLQSGMEHATEKRRGEVEDLQQELIQIQSRAMKQDREIVAMKMQLEEGKLEHKAEVVRLKDVIATMEKESPLAKTVAELENDDRMLEVRERLEQLRKRNTDLQEENLRLGGRLERAVIEIKSFDTERQHAEEMEKENSTLRVQVKQLEQILEGTRKQRSSHSTGQAQVPPSTGKENPTGVKGKSSKKSSKGSLRGFFKKRSQGFQADEIIKEEKEEDVA